MWSYVKFIWSLWKLRTLEINSFGYHISVIGTLTLNATNQSNQYGNIQESTVFVSARQTPISYLDWRVIVHEERLTDLLKASLAYRSFWKSHCEATLLHLSLWPFWLMFRRLKQSLALSSKLLLLLSMLDASWWHFFCNCCCRNLSCCCNH